MKRLIQIANDNNVSKQTIYKRLSQYSRVLHGHVHKHNNYYLVDRVGQKIISKSISQTTNYKRKHSKQINVKYITKLGHAFEDEIHNVRADYKTELKDKNHTIKSLAIHINNQDMEIKQLRKDLQEARKHVSLWEIIRKHLNTK